MAISEALSQIAKAHRLDPIATVNEDSVAAFAQRLFAEVPCSEFTIKDFQILSFLKSRLHQIERAREQQIAGSSNNRLIEQVDKILAYMREKRTLFEDFPLELQATIAGSMDRSDMAALDLTSHMG